MWWLVVSSLALAGPTPVSWEGVADRAVAAWSEAEGASVAARLDALDAARRVAGPPVVLATEVRMGAPGAQEATGTVGLPLGVGVRARRAIDAERRSLRASGHADRLVFVERVLDDWTAWWTAHELAEHLASWSGEVEAMLAPLEAAADEGLLAVLDLEDLRAELAQVRAEVASARAEEERRAVAVRRWLGAGVVLDPGGHHLHDEAALDRGDPWTPLIARSETAPEVAAAREAAEALSARARAVGAWRPQLDLGVAITDGARSGGWVPLGVAGISLPLRAMDAPDARMLRGRAEAAAREAGWRETRVEGAWRLEGASWAADRERAVRLQEEVVRPLGARLARLEAAFAEGLVAADRVVRARRDHHEAEHERLVVVARLLSAQARADAVAQLLEDR